MEFDARIMLSKQNEIEHEPDHSVVLSARISLADTSGVTVDMSMLNDLAAAQVAGAPDLIVELIDLYLEDTLRRMANMQAAIAATDNAALKQSAHAPRGSSASLGARQMAALCAELEGLASADSWPTARALLNRLQQAFADVRQAFAAERQRRM